MELPLVVGVDGSESSMRAVDWAADEAALRGVPLRLVYASLWERYEGAALADGLGRPPEQVIADDIVEAAAQRAHRRHADVKISTDVLPEEPAPALLREGNEAFALVLGSRGRSGLAELLLGSVSLAVAARAYCPVIVLRGSQDNRAGAGGHRRIVLAVGEEPDDPAAVRFAVAEARARGCAVEAVRAWRRPAREALGHPLSSRRAARLHEERATEVLEAVLSGAPPDVELRRRAVEGPARKVLLDASATADLLVVGARRHPGHSGLQLGRVAHAMLHHSACPVAVVPHRG
ncbi:universal stress protein [Streptomyces avermitilis]|uniref:Stress-inducible protein n=2 Tax=Streptomyces avermitilis TaxID=33903 RepID=Q82NM7_STRAW|nr:MULTISPECIES: universal stress protein [Streptomyces]KUN55451.1 universal stress protein [Streptomyces avermitilis]MYS96906.1 universal stress protein [Streptomyces sp. SID5469]OOV26784.1 universal stress protein [Streptomyces avermitilis]BAC68985.1 putative stress-inducible protein [Streptomyces avermitilis MA-4680 = NBRC 14893]BBJ48922.1 universal stress protein [Streptomyces avermitilis]